MTEGLPVLSAMSEARARPDMTSDVAPVPTLAIT